VSISYRMPGFYYPLRCEARRQRSGVCVYSYRVEIFCRGDGSSPEGYRRTVAGAGQLYPRIRGAGQVVGNDGYVHASPKF
jgi:hypothetical protein